MIQTLRNKPIIINSDLDGILSGLLLKKYLNCNIVGFSNSSENIWFNESLNIPYADVCFVDIFIANPEVICIDQHIIAANEEHLVLLQQNKNKINPNLLNARFHASSRLYRKKYPFGTVHFIIALLEKEGVDLGDLNFRKEVRSGVSFIDVLLRADDAMQTTVDSRYTKNASDWWKWLEELSNDGKSIEKLRTYLDSVSPENASIIKATIKKVLKNEPFYCDTSDGGVFNLTSNERLFKSTRKYFRFLADLSGIEVFDLDAKFKKFSGISERFSLNQKQVSELITTNTINEKKVFSYAFVKSKQKEECFSVTFYQTKPLTQ